MPDHGWPTRVRPAHARRTRVTTAPPLVTPLLFVAALAATWLVASPASAQTEGTGASASRWERTTANAHTEVTFVGDLGATPELLAWVLAYEEREHAALESLGAYERASRAAAAPDDPFELLTCEARWVVTWAADGFTSVYREAYLFTGGAHGFTAFDSLLWDAARGADVPFAELLVDPSQDGEAMSGLRRELVAALKDDVEARLGDTSADPSAIGEEGERHFAPGSEALGRFAVIAGTRPGSIAALQWYVAEGRVEASAAGSFSPRVPCSLLVPYLAPAWAARCDSASTE